MSNKLKTLLGDVLEPRERNIVFSSYDVIGDIIIMKLPDSLVYKRHAIGKRLLNNTKSVNSIFLQTSSVEGDFRLRKLELIAGADRTLTEYREHGCVFKVDVSEVYFSPRLSTERLRITERIRDGQIITNMFAGVGTFSILIAKRNPRSRVFSIDSNSRANTLCLINAKLNRVQDRVFPFCGDAKYIAGNILLGLSHHVLMPLPEKAKEFVSAAISCIGGKGGFIYYFAHVGACNRLDAIYRGNLDTTEAFRQYRHKVIATRVVREVGPRLYQIVSDVFIPRC